MGLMLYPVLHSITCTGPISRRARAVTLVDLAFDVEDDNLSGVSEGAADDRPGGLARTGRRNRQ
jgi:hypothetical protein